MQSEIEYKTIDSINEELLREAAILHIDGLSYRSFITLFGVKFITEIYKDALRNNIAFFVFALDNNKVFGYVMGCTDTQQLFKSVFKKFPKYIGIMLPKIIMSPRLIIKLFETLFYVDKENTAVNSELVVIVTNANYRSKGIGAGLVNNLDKEFLKRGINQYKVTVHDEMVRSNKFYINLGMKLSTSFKMYGVKFNLYVNSIGF
jgi:GNAT superfamily N-acetyltransferase